jgi:fructose-specific phosphotransferase system IIC component
VSSKSKRLGFVQSFLRSILLAIFTLVIVNLFFMLINKTPISIFDHLTDTGIKNKKTLV